MDLENGLKSFQENIKPLGHWVWFMLLGALVVIFSIIYRPEYIPLGLYSFVFGILGYFITMLIDKITLDIYAERDKEGKLVVNTKWERIVRSSPIWYSVVMLAIRLAILSSLICIILHKYPSFWPC